MNLIKEIFDYPFLIRTLNKILNDNDKFYLFCCSKYFYQKKFKFDFSESITSITITNIENINSKKVTPFTTHLNLKFYSEVELPKIPFGPKFLTFSGHFNSFIESVIPNSITHLTFGSKFNKSIQNSIPPSVTHLTFDFDFNQTIIGNIPTSVTHLRIENNAVCFHKPAEELRDTSNRYHSKFDQRIDNLHEGLLVLKLSWSYTRKINNLPSTLQKLTISKKCYEINKDVIPIDTKLFHDYHSTTSCGRVGCRYNK